jgi:hypothetical protein
MNLLKDKKGFVLESTILIIVLVTALIAAELLSITNAVRIASTDSWNTRTLAAANGMVDHTLATMPETLLPGDSVYLGRYNYRSNLFGEAWLVRTDSDTLDIRRTYTIYTGATAGDSIVTREVALDIVIRGQPLWNLRAGMVALGGLKKNGIAGIITGISGADVCGDSVPGLIAPDSSVWNNKDKIVVPGDKEKWLDGNPPLVYDDSVVNQLDFGEWNEIRNMPTDYIITDGSEWPSPDVFNYTWPVIMVTNGGTMLDATNSGRGIIIAPNDLTDGSEFVWEGIILVGNRILVNGNAVVDGVILTGLDRVLGSDVNRSDLGNGTQNFRFNSCTVRAALSYFNPNRTMGNWRIIR